MFLLPIIAFCLAGATEIALADPYAASLVLLKDKNPAVRHKGARDLGVLGRPEAAEALLDILDDNEPMVRAAAADSLGLLRAPQGPRMAKLLAKDKDPGVRQTAATALAYMRDPAAGDALTAALEDAAWGVRFAAMRTLGLMRWAQAVTPLSKILSDSDPALRRSAADALGMIQTSEVIAPLKRLLAVEKDPEVRAAVIRALGNIPGVSAQEELQQGLKDPKPEVRLQAALALGRGGDLSGLPVVIEIIKNADPSLRLQAAHILGYIGDEKQGLAALNAALGAEKESSPRTAMETARGQLKLRWGIKDPEPAPAAKVLLKGGRDRSPAGSSHSNNSMEGTVPRSGTTAAPAKAAPVKPRASKKKP